VQEGTLSSPFAFWKGRDKAAIRKMFSRYQGKKLAFLSPEKILYKETLLNPSQSLLYLVSSLVPRPSVFVTRLIACYLVPSFSLSLPHPLFLPSFFEARNRGQGGTQSQTTGLPVSYSSPFFPPLLFSFVTI
jgi:hypothetical protein